MTKERLRNLFLNWKGLELINSLKSIIKYLSIIISIIIVFISVANQNYYILLISLMLIFLPLFLGTNKEPYLKYKEVFEISLKAKKTNVNKNWENYLEKTAGLNSLTKWLVGLYYEDKFEIIFKSKKK